MSKRRRKSSRKKSIWERLFRNKYFLAFLGFAVWMVFFDRNDLPTQVKLDRAINELEGDKEYYREKIAEIKVAQKTVESDKEKFAREKYFLTQPKEDVFIIVKE